MNRRNLLLGLLLMSVVSGCSLHQGGQGFDGRNLFGFRNRSRDYSPVYQPHYPAPLYPGDPVVRRTRHRRHTRQHGIQHAGMTRGYPGEMTAVGCRPCGAPAFGMPGYGSPVMNSCGYQSCEPVSYGAVYACGGVPADSCGCDECLSDGFGAWGSAEAAVESGCGGQFEYGQPMMPSCDAPAMSWGWPQQPSCAAPWQDMSTQNVMMPMTSGCGGCGTASGLVPSPIPETALPPAQEFKAPEAPPATEEVGPESLMENDVAPLPPNVKQSELFYPAEVESNDIIIPVAAETSLE